MATFIPKPTPNQTIINGARAKTGNAPSAVTKGLAIKAADSENHKESPRTVPIKVPINKPTTASAPVMKKLPMKLPAMRSCQNSPATARGVPIRKKIFLELLPNPSQIRAKSRIIQV
jgi:hypothetical protein